MASRAPEMLDAPDEPGEPPPPAAPAPRQQGALAELIASGRMAAPIDVRVIAVFLCA